ncbi:MAG: BCCT family transporter [Candidatus Omnitrophica bacterium]|nr:BCCT family transporter [Candidatus Omnitrophota bacterium]
MAENIDYESEHPTYANGRRDDFHPVVFITSAGLILSFVFLSLLWPDRAFEVFSTVKSEITHAAGWFFMLAADFFLLTCIYLLFAKGWDIRLGGPDAEPDFSYSQWMAMLFSAGMGIGLVFWSVAEPVTHLQTPPLETTPAISPEAAGSAMAMTYFHWGLHAWGIYSLMGLALAYFSFNRGLPLTIRSTLHPLLGERIHGNLGNLVDIVASVATLFGVATSLGFGVQQVNSGLHYAFGVDKGTAIQIILIAVITALATTSVVLGLDKGIRRLSELNMVMAALLLAFVFIAGPTLFELNGFVQNLGHYFQQFIELSSWTEAYRDTTWREGWTIFYWAWWIAWSPFVGMFIARISRGRTVREFILGVLFVPAMLTFLWLSVFGNAAIHEVLGGSTAVADAVNADVSTSLFALLQNYGFPLLSSILAIIVIVLFFVTSSDSGSLVIDIITAGGHLDPPLPQRIFWAITEGVVAAVLLYVGGDQALTSLQTAAIATGLPFAIVLVAVGISLIRALSRESEGMRSKSV